MSADNHRTAEATQSGDLPDLLEETTYGPEDDRKEHTEDNKSADQQNQEHHRTKTIEAMQLVEDLLKELFLDQYGTPYAALEVGDHVEVLSVRKRRLRNYLRYLFFNSTGKALTGEEMSNILSIFEAKAQSEGRIRHLHLRVAEQEGAIYYDLTNAKWEAVKITPDGYSIETSPPILFARYANLVPQDYPAIGKYDKDIFEKFLSLFNVKDAEGRLLIKCYIVSLFVPGVPKPVLMLHGEQGSAKSTMQELIKTLVDPCSVKTLTFPRDINELVQTLAHNYLAYFDNVSHLSEWTSDALCRAVTGSGFSKRALYSDDSDIIYNFTRCIGFNGINLAATKADLLDRGLIIQMERIHEDKRRKIKDIWADFDNMKPQLLAYIFDTLVIVLKNRHAFSLERPPRMADFAELGEVISRAMGHRNNDFINAYYRNIGLQTEQAIDANPVAQAVLRLIEGREDYYWIGSATELFSALEVVAQELKINTARNENWPKAPHILIRRLNEIKTNLRQVRVTIERPNAPDSHTRLVEIRKVAPQAPEGPEVLDSFIPAPENPSGIISVDKVAPTTAPENAMDK